jgi:hypothetical protein
MHILRTTKFDGAFWLAAVFLAIHVAVAALSTRAQSLTYDERLHFRYGMQILDLNSDRFDDSKMPFSALNAIPVVIASRLWPEAVEGVWQPERIGRISTILFSGLVGLVLVLWSRDWYGAAAGAAAGFLYAFEPNLLAHAGLMTTDVYAAGMTAVTIYAFWRFLERPRLAGALLSSLLLGLSQLAKYTCVSLYVILPLLAAAHAFGARRLGPSVGRRAGAGKLAGVVLLFLLVSLLVINAGFLFNRTFTPLGEYTFRSDVLTWVQATFPALGRWPVPVPYPYLEGLDLVRYRDVSGEGYGQVYLLGQTRAVGGFPGYFFVASLFKMPLAEQLIILAALAVFVIPHRGRGFWEREVFVLLPAALYALYFNVLLGAQIGLRLYLVVFPLLIVLGARLFRDWGLLAARRRGLLLAGGVWMAASVASYYPHFIPYFNELVWNRLHAYRILSDSNIDYGQAKDDLAVYQSLHPQAAFEPAEPPAGMVIISVDRLTGVRDSPDWYRDLSRRLEPVDHIAYCYLVYDLSLEDAEALTP